MKTNLHKLLVLLFTFLALTSVSFGQKSVGKQKFVVVLDAGHGGKDPGNMGGGFKEKNIALSIILKIGHELEKNNDIRVIYTRDKDVFIPLDERARIANDAHADLFVSVHCNSHTSQANGTETWVLGLSRNKDNMDIAKKENSVIYLEDNYKATYNGFDPNSPESYIGLTLMQEEFLDQSIMLADFVEKKFTNELHRNDRGVKQNIFLVLRETYMPSVLIETGFLTNHQEGPFLNSESGQTKMAHAIVDGIDEYMDNININVVQNSEAQAPPKPTQKDVVSDLSDNYEGITFKVQLAASSKKLEPTSRNFKGLTPVFREKEGKLYKYYYGATSSYAHIKNLHHEAISAGFKSSYLVAFKNGNKLTVKEALNSEAK